MEFGHILISTVICGGILSHAMCNQPFVKLLQVIELDLNQLPDGDEVLTILRQEQAPLHNWVMLAVCTATGFVSCLLTPSLSCTWRNFRYVRCRTPKVAYSMPCATYEQNICYAVCHANIGIARGGPEGPRPRPPSD